MYVVKKVVQPQESLSKKKFSMRSNMAVSEALENEHRASQRSSEECSQIVFSVLCCKYCLFRSRLLPVVEAKT